MLEKQHRQECIQIRVGHRTQGSMESREGMDRMCQPSPATAAYRSGLRAVVDEAGVGPSCTHACCYFVDFGA